MIVKIAKFKVKKEKLEECLTAIRQFVKAVSKNEPHTLFYESYQKIEEPTAFFHVMKFENSNAEQHHRTTTYVKKFVEVLYPNCEEEPVFTDLKQVS